MRRTRAQSTPIVILGTLIIAAIVITGCAVDLEKWLQPSQSNSPEKINSYVTLINQQTNLGQAGIETRKLILKENELVMFFSAGTEPIKLVYTGSNTADNGHFIFRRPQDVACTDQACVCYCFQGPFWRVTEEDPFLEPRRLFMNENLTGSGWQCTQMTCKAVDDSNIQFINSRGYDAGYVNQGVDNYKDGYYQPVELDIPTFLQGEYKGKDLFFKDGFWKKVSTRLKKTVFVDPNLQVQKKNQIRYLLENYQWQGGVVLGAYGYSPTLETRKDRIIEMPVTNISIETVTQPHVVGICMQQQCIYANALSAVQNTAAQQQALVQAKQSFSRFKLHITQDIPNCLANAGTTSAKEACMRQLENELLINIPTSTGQDTYTIGIESDAQGLTQFNLLEFKGGVETTIDSVSSGLPYPYIQKTQGTPTTLLLPQSLTKDTNNLIILSEEPSIATTLSIATTPSGVDTILFQQS